MQQQYGSCFAFPGMNEGQYEACETKSTELNALVQNRNGSGRLKNKRYYS